MTRGVTRFPIPRFTLHVTDREGTGSYLRSCCVGERAEYLRLVEVTSKEESEWEVECR